MPDPTRTAADAAAAAGSTHAETSTTAAVPGYELLDEVGRGGMGVVFRARDVALDREVAVKILQEKFAPASGTARRFVDKARITAQLQHPGIPAVYHVGTLADGRPFLAMKLIKGDTLDALLKTNAPLDPLAVFEAISQAVGYAHAHGVIHRDLKPANVMVGAFGEVQVMDWGLAKVLTVSRDAQRIASAADPEATTAPTEIRSLRETDGSFTQAGSVLGTPAFMPPEQAAGELDKVDTRSDVFGLGAILCVLLTGQPPFDGKDAESVRLNAVRGKTEAAFARLDASATDPDVIALCKRCLAFEPVDRPTAANDVAKEIAALRRAADDRAKQAERDRLSAEVRAAEQTKRRKLLQWAAVVVVWVLAGGVVASVWQAKRAMWAEADAHFKRQDAELAKLAAEAARQTAEGQRKLAEAKEAEANAVVRFFQDKVFAAARPKGQDGGLGKDVPLRDAIAASLPALATGFADKPLVEARLRLTLAHSFRYLGDAAAAAEQDERARAIYLAQFGPDNRDTLRSTNSLANSYDDVGRYADAHRLREELLAAYRRLLPPDHPNVLLSLNNLAVSHLMLGRDQDALRLWEETLAARKRVLPPDDPDTLTSLSNLAYIYHKTGRRGDALKLHEEALAARKRVLAPDHPDTLTSMSNLASSYTSLGRHDEALKLHEAALAAWKRVLPLDHSDTLTSLAAVADALCELDRGAEAIPLIDECVARAAGKIIGRRLILPQMNRRLQHFRRTNDPAGCRATAEMWEQLNRSEAVSFYAATRMRAVAAAVQAQTPGADAARLATADADRAMNWLMKAVAAGFKDRGQLEQDADLDTLRSRADFRAVVATLRYQAPPPRPVR